MRKPSLRSRLFRAHLTVLAIGIITLTIVGWLYTPRLFILRLRRIQGSNFRMAQVQGQLVEVFQFAWGRGMLWAALLGGISASSLSYWLSQRIVDPLLEMEGITRAFASGELDRRLPEYEILELTQLANSVNHMAADIQSVEQRRRDLVSDLSHELRTPLTILKGYLEGLSDGTLEADPAIYDRLIRETGRLQRLVNDLQELSQLESGYLSINPRPTDLHDLLASIMARFTDQRLPDDPVQLRLHYPKKLPLVQADAERIEQVMVNLLSNALRHTEVGYVQVRVWSEGMKVWVSVEDTGPGIAPEDVNHVFDRFWRADRSRDRASGGTGIGLTICQRLIDLHGGHIEVESIVGQGSIFRFWLPIAGTSGSHEARSRPLLEKTV
ncbi:HAMP domain-containing sensor histidine kinase [Oscillatoria sp. CS-180]|uniref:sensor histidine kinase n=1 Tax=Oscillatoria sp. CS-180 TaxID=3021720 RepID=UPI00232D678E|nr:HAMP domain-containing sensor histidine kinase [Oscillatoria sp. CS-180]MDB9524426.1 HAMP domain-containing sensor histidine kinase [Oscillatoria sp. CS-180]